MASKTAFIRDVVEVPYDRFAIVDKGVDNAEINAPGPWRMEVAEDEWFTPAENGAIILIDFRRRQSVTVWFELWDGVPDTPESWDKSWEGSLSFISSEIRLSGSDDMGFQFDFDLGRRETSWNVSAYMHKVREVRDGDFESPPFDLEVYTFQFWPKD
ncbi:hypothetical protein [Planomonospora algeriensis]